MKSVQTLLRITHLAYMKSYLVIICLNPYEKLNKNELDLVGVGSNIAQNHSSSLCDIIYGHYWPNSHEKSTKYAIRSSYYLL